ncbi:MAG: pimeloyl-ACP methyl ester carboxylesterase [Phycisphaerales bacterium]|jgi:pimeloyl-ACP methyl ester carboxylesterase
MTDQPTISNPDAPAPAPAPKRLARTRRWAKHGLIGGVIVAASLAGASCVQLDRPNAAFPATTAQISEAREQMRADPIGLARPVIVLSGYRSPPGSSAMLAGKIRKLTGAEPEQVVYLSYMWSNTVQSPARKVVAFVEEKFPSDDPGWTTEVDVVAISMGGLVARLAAADPALRDEPDDGIGKRLKIHTLYTLGSPHRGSILADKIAVDPASRSMVAGSDFLEALDSEFSTADYKIVPYAVLRDNWVGAKRSAPFGQEPIWVSGRLIFSHHMIGLNRRIQADLARRLRGEEPLGQPSEPPRN